MNSHAPPPVQPATSVPSHEVQSHQTLNWHASLSLRCQHTPAAAAMLQRLTEAVHQRADGSAFIGLLCLLCQLAHACKVLLCRP